MDSSIVDPNDPTLSQAFEQLDAEIAQANPDTKPDSATTAPPAPVPEKKDGPPPQPPAKEGAPATESPKPPEASKEPTKYEKAASRQAEAWKQINTEKDEVRSLRKQLEADREAIQKEREAFEAEQAKASQPKYKPEDYESAAERWESEGKYDWAEAARQQAKELRDHPPAPPPDAKKAEDDFKAQQKEWWGKAGVDFPNVLKKDSAEAQALAALVKSEPAIYNDPKGMYYAARLVSAEVAAARVPTMEKELGEAHAKIKDLEGQLAVPNEGVVSGAPKGDLPYEQKSADEQFADVERMAKELDAHGQWP